jgi:hypothetical protein
MYLKKKTIYTEKMNTCHAGDFNCNFILFSCHNIYHYLSQIRERDPDSHLDHRNRNQTWTKHVWPAWARKIVRSYAPERDPDYTDQPLHLSQEHLRKEHDNKSRENLSIPYDLWLTHRGMQSSNNSEARLLGTIKNLFNTLLTLHIICLNRIFKNFQFRPSILSMLH